MARQKLDRRDGQGSARRRPHFDGDAERQQHEPQAAEQSHHPIVRPDCSAGYPCLRLCTRAHGSIRAHGASVLNVAGMHG